MERGGQESQEKEKDLMSKYSEFSNFFYPRNIVVIGVSPEPHNLGKNIVLNLLTLGYRGEILSVGLKKGVVFGQQIYRSIDEIERDIHLAIVLTPAKAIPDILEQCGRKGIKWVVIESAGFSEMGEEGRPLETACLEIAERNGIRFIGPNGIGIINMENGLGMSFMPLPKDIPLGSVSILAQSGGVYLSYLGFLTEENIGVNKVVSIGNKLNVDESDLLEYLIHDEGTRIILLYLESFNNGRRFVEIASRSEKPILVHKSNRFKASAQVAQSHTAALFSDDELVDYALDQAGCVRVNTMDDAMDYIKILTMPTLKGNRLALVSRSGGHAVIAADACAHYGFHLPPFPEDFLKKIESRVRAHVIRLQNPLDLGDLFDLDFYEFIVEEMLKWEGVDGVLLGHGYRQGAFEQEASRRLIDRVTQLVERYQKPVALVILAEALERDYLKKHFKIPIFSAPENAMRAFNLSHRWASGRPSPLETETIRGINKERAAAVLERAGGLESLLLEDCFDLIERYGFSLPDYRSAVTPDEALEAWRSLGGPVAMKINRPHVSHKTDFGAVRLNINSGEGIREAFHALKAIVGGNDMEVLIQTMVDNGREVVLGGKRDRVFGPVILFGLGGIFVEAMGDVVWRIAPVSREEARRMINQIKGIKLLSGIRGEGPHDLRALEDLLVRLSQMLVDLPVIREIDINPVLVHGQGQGAQAVDARVILQHGNP
jgi:acetyltransferase